MYYNAETHGCERNPSVEGWLKDDFCSYGEKQVASKLKNADDSLLAGDTEECKEQKSKLESDDTVSKAVFEQIKWERDTALQTLEEHGIGLGERKTEYRHGLYICEELIESLPPVEPKRPKGEWKDGNGNGECPFCGRERQYGWDNFCGFCGADMRGADDEAD